MASNKINVMHDIETVGTVPGSAILSIGATSFCMGTGERRKFYEKISLEDSLAEGFTQDEATRKWWSEQNSVVRAEAFSGTKTVIEVLYEYAEFLTGALDGDEVLLWGNGSDFDNVLVAAAYQKLQMPLPWNSRNNRCYRTLKGLPGIPDKPQTVGAAHNALVDAVNQANHAELILNKLSGRR